MQADWKPDPQATAFKVCRYTSSRLRLGNVYFYLLPLLCPGWDSFLRIACYSPMWPVNISPTGHQSQVIKGSPLCGSHKTRATWGRIVGDRKDRICQPPGLWRVLQSAPWCLYNYKPAPSARAFKISKQASFTERQCISVCCLWIGPWGLATVSLCEPFKNYLLVLYSLMSLVDASLIGFQN